MRKEIELLERSGRNQTDELTACDVRHGTTVELWHIHCASPYKQRFVEYTIAAFRLVL